MRIVTKILVGTVRVYQVLLSPFFTPCCRFHPSCSEYAIEALKKHGPLKGLYLGLMRLLRCHPFSQGGYDPVR